MRQNYRLTSNIIHENFLDQYFGRRLGADIPSRWTIWRAIKDLKYTYKKSEAQSHLQCPIEAFEYVMKIRRISHLDMIDCDGCNNNQESFEQRYGYAPSGQRCIRYQQCLQTLK